LGVTAEFTTYVVAAIAASSGQYDVREGFRIAGRARLADLPIAAITRDFLQPFFHPLAQSPRFGKESHAVHQVLEGHDADQAFLVDDGDER
jgi:hypothetical protein